MFKIISCLLYRNIPTGVGRRKDSSSRRSNLSEHPHGRGEKMSRRRVARALAGTSPRAWGEVGGDGRVPAQVRNISTGVGRSSRRSRGGRTCTEHPHGRGEKLSLIMGGFSNVGTSPRAWGEGRLRSKEHTLSRNIPTGVGRSASGAAGRRQTPEHPHGRGEKAQFGERERGVRGTSPRAWGEGEIERRFHVSSRNIPTGVGRRALPGAQTRSTAEHPHGRGEKHGDDGGFDRGAGTSPRAWGEGRVVRALFQGRRNIPTGVGRRPGTISGRSARTEHPHGRGEKASAARPSISRSGTSPRAWGEGVRWHEILRMRRNIPTGVGRSVRTYSPTMCDAEHPHGRGEKEPRGEFEEVGDGTSPRAWGEGSGGRNTRVSKRNIPTGVGRRRPPSSQTARSSEHPHGRGEKSLLDSTFARSTGTSPRAWGEGRGASAARR